MSSAAGTSTIAFIRPGFVTVTKIVQMAQMRMSQGVEQNYNVNKTNLPAQITSSVFQPRLSVQDILSAPIIATRLIVQLLSSLAIPQLNLTALAMGKCVFQPGKYAMGQTIAVVGKMSLSRVVVSMSAP